MKTKKLLIILGILIFISGCSDFIMICSLNPFYVEENIAMIPEVEGKWSVEALQSKKDSTEKNSSNWELADTISTWQIRRYIIEEKVKTARGKDSTVFKPQKSYLVKLVNAQDSDYYQYKMVLFKVNQALYADFCPDELPPLEKSRMAKENTFPVHTLAKITIQNKQLKISWLGADYMKTMIEEKRVRIKYRYVPDAKRLMLTASSGDLTEMIEKYAHQKRFIDWNDQPAMLQLTPVN